MSATASELRKAAEPAFRDGLCGLIRAFNMTNEPTYSWTFPAAQQDQVMLLFHALMKLFHNGEIKAHPMAAASALAHGDGDFQQFMYQAVTKPQRKRKARGTP